MKYTKYRSYKPYPRDAGAPLSAHRRGQRAKAVRETESAQHETQPAPTPTEAESDGSYLEAAGTDKAIQEMIAKAQGY